MRGQNSGQKESLLIGLGAVAVFAVLVWVTLQSPYILHRLELPLLITESRIYSTVSNSVYGSEHRALTGLLKTMKDEYAKNGYKRIDGKKARKYARNIAARTILTTKAISLAILACLLFPFLKIVRSARKTAFDTDQYIQIPRAGGIDGFILGVEKYLPPGVIENLRNAPTAANIAAAFTIARQRVNLPNNLLGRLFPPWSNERMTIYEYGKGLVEYDMERMQKEKNSISEGGKDENRK